MYFPLVMYMKKMYYIHIRDDTGAQTMKNVKKMTYKELEQKVIENRKILLETKDLGLKRKLIAESHELMVEMDRRWN